MRYWNLVRPMALSRNRTDWTFRATEMAAEFPHATVVGVDLAPCPLDPNTTPENFHFELDNIDLGLSHFFNQFDFVQARGLSMGVSSTTIGDEFI
jgi:hypothetical protein